MPDVTGLSPQMLTPDFLGSLQNTLTTSGVMSQMEAEFNRMQEAAAKQTAAASEAAAQAGQQYQSAAAAPPADVNPLEALIRSSLGNVASVIGQDKGYADRAREETQAQRKSLVQARIENLSALKQNYEKRAAALEQAGHDEEALKTRLSIEKYNNLLQQLGKEEDHKFAREQQDRTFKQQSALEGQRSANDIKLAEAKAKTDATAAVGTDLANNADVYDKPDGSQVPYVNLGAIKLPKAREAVRVAARSAGIPALEEKQVSALQMVKSVRGDMQFITDNIVPLLPSSGGLTRMAQGTKNKVAATFQAGKTGEMLAGYPATRTAAIKTIQALASLGTGLRINQAEIKAAQDFDYPRIDDAQGTAEYKFKILGMMLGHIEDALLGHPPSTAEVQKALSAAAAIKRGQIPKETASDVTAPPSQYKRR